MKYAIGQFVRIKPDAGDNDYGLTSEMRRFVISHNFICKISRYYYDRYVFAGLDTHAYPESCILGGVEDPVFTQRKRESAINKICGMCKLKCHAFESLQVMRESEVCGKLKNMIELSDMLGSKDFPHPKYHQVKPEVKKNVAEPVEVTTSSPLYYKYLANVMISARTQDEFNELMTDLSRERTPDNRRWTYINGSYPKPSEEVWGRLKSHSVVMLQPKTLRIRIMDDRAL
jgi:hypothetical protein